MATNTLSSVYKPLHEYRILRVSNSPHLCEFCTTLSAVTQHLSLCTVSSLTKHPACLEHHQVSLPTSSRSSNSAIPIFVRYAFFFACLSSWCLSRKGVDHSSECQTWMPASPSDSFPYTSMSVFPKRGKARTARYIPVRQLTGTWTSRYWAVLLKSIVGGRLRKKKEEEEEEVEKKKEEEEKKKKEEEEKYLARAPSLPAGRPRAIAAHG
ncbi:hypothetical protein BHM03_00052217 [Ensete ventricosum]|nr:hypothetical protein BHM03_00052217 [Ensete ventricosum]